MSGEGGERRTFRIGSGLRLAALGPTTPAVGGAVATKVATLDGEAILVELPEWLPVEAFRARERVVSGEPHVVAAREVGMLVSEESSRSPYRGAAREARGYALYPLRAVRTLGAALGRARAGATFAPRIVAALAVECAHGLSATEDLDLLTPASITIDGEGTARVRGPLLEALAARQRAEEDKAGPRWVGYLAPELLRAGATPTPAARLFALGVMLFELLAGRALFEGTGPAVVQQIARWSPPLGESFGLMPDIPQELRSIVWSLLQRDPAMRAAPKMLVDVLAPLYEPDFEAGARLAPDAGLSPIFAV